MLFVRLLRFLSNGTAFLHILNPFHLSFMVGLDGTMVDLAKSHATKSSDDDAQKEVRNQSLVEM